MRRVIYVAIGLTAIAGLAGALACSGTSASAPTPVSTVVPSTASAATPTPGGQAVSATPAAAGGLSRPFAGVSGADAANLITGTIASTAPGFITVSTQRGPLRLAVDDSTRATVVVPATRSDLKVDENVAVTGPRSDDGTVTAQLISLNADLPGAGAPADGQARPGAAGGEGGFFRRQGQAGTADQPGGAGGPGAQANQVRPGGAFGGAPFTAEQADRLVQQAIDSGRLTADQAADLRSRLLGTPGPGLPGDGNPRAGIIRQAGGRVFGKITSIDGDKLAVEANSGQVQVAIAGDTAIQRVEHVLATDLAPGTLVSVAAERGSDGVVRATAVFVGTDGPGSAFGSPFGQRQP